MVLGDKYILWCLARDTTIPHTARARIVRGSVGVNIQNVQGISPPAQVKRWFKERMEH